MAERQRWEYGSKARPAMSRGEVERKFKPYPMPEFYRHIFGSKDSTLQRRLTVEELREVLKHGLALEEKTARHESDTAMPTISAAEQSEIERLEEKAKRAGGDHALPIIDQVRYLQLYYMRGTDRISPLPARRAKDLAILQTKALRLGKESLKKPEIKRLLSLVEELGISVLKPAKQKK